MNADNHLAADIAKYENRRFVSKGQGSGDISVAQAKRNLKAWQKRIKIFPNG